MRLLRVAVVKTTAAKQVPNLQNIYSPLTVHWPSAVRQYPPAKPNWRGNSTNRGRIYCGGGSARYFSHSPAAPAEVINNVSAAVRAFWTSGQRARFNGVDAQGRAQYRAVSDLEDEAARQLYSCTKTTPGSFVDFHLSPTITALSPLASTFPFESAAIAWQQPQKPSSFAGSLSQEGMLNELAADFARAFKDLSIIFSDIKRIAALGDLPVKMEKPNVLRVRFPESMQERWSDCAMTWVCSVAPLERILTLHFQWVCQLL
ncbi:unnamed protein product [Parascedosporium putredinis]|uniref:Uncharacterized protein n=1 Tax=Parascedosporium putredinis TaxID=1442378 RepID=A0A9P1H4L7_9PEZI|nr:unnamed protein product [Parascedosporium putredinis]CAI7998400.1 unnamed protein product [Parascedosporium putredinis]